MPRTIQAEMLGRLSHDPDRATRLAALNRLIALDVRPQWSRCADGVISTFCSDENAAVARIALRHLVRRRWPGLARLLVTLVHSPHEEIRHLAGANLAPLGFTKFWEAWPKLSYAQQLAGGNALIKLDPNFHRLLGERLGRPERNSRLRAMAIIYGLNQATFFETPLLALARESDEVIASAAVRALGSASSPAVVEALELALRHSDSRVRANSVESLQQIRSTRHVNRLMEMARTDDSRPRANAIHALMEMRAGEALASLTNMLADTRPAQRISVALWLVDHLGLVDVARRRRRVGGHRSGLEGQGPCRDRYSTSDRLATPGTGTHESSEPEPILQSPAAPPPAIHGRTHQESQNHDKPPRITHGHEDAAA